LSVFQNYTVNDRDQFLTHPVFSRLYCLLYYTLLPLYLQEMKEEFKEMVLIELLNIFDLMLHS
jgi:hypothetical protein